MISFADKQLLFELQRVCRSLLIHATHKTPAESLQHQKWCYNNFYLRRCLPKLVHSAVRLQNSDLSF